MNFFHKIASGLSVVAEVLLATLSFVFFKTVKFVVRRMLTLYYRVAVKQAFLWKFSSAGLMEMPGALPMIMTTGPRWNTHAIIGSAGPVAVKRSLTVDVGAAQRSAGVWTVVICTFPDYKSVTMVSSRNAPFSGSNIEIPLAPGKYWIYSRYYHWGKTVELPAIAIDGNHAIDSVAVPPDVNDFYLTLYRKTNFFYLCLHYHTYVMLRYRRYFPSKFVEREIVPLGNPETRFFFGALQAGECLSVQADPQALISSDIYITMYNRASFPVASYGVTSADFLAPPAAADCIYLIRVHDKTAVPADSNREGLRISVRPL